jgi:hypothetical protein
MSADNWAICPKCKEKAKRMHVNLLNRIETDYGKVTANEYLELIEQSKQSIEEEHTLREDWEIGIWNNEFFVSYRASCSVCKFSYNFKYKEEI